MVGSNPGLDLGGHRESKVRPHIELPGYKPVRGIGGSDGAGFDDPQERVLDGVVAPHAAEGDAARFTIVEQASPAGMARDVVM
ncbi:hypothetical protein [Gemmobacter aquaticus]|uniref:hypothetical protein n=1 Tax=Gemmobacter aquaticus TaxID=490185 RepID=UPI0019D5EFEC|nr:hypothetical protein [Gemmobacter aquaticus]